MRSRCLQSGIPGSGWKSYRRGAVFSYYVYRGFKKPYLGPVFTPEGESYTRADAHNPEHPHQRSVFVGLGEVKRGELPVLDFWNEPEGLWNRRARALRRA